MLSTGTVLFCSRTNRARPSCNIMQLLKIANFFFLQGYQPSSRRVWIKCQGSTTAKNEDLGRLEGGVFRHFILSFCNGNRILHYLEPLVRTCFMLKAFTDEQWPQVMHNTRDLMFLKFSMNRPAASTMSPRCWKWISPRKKAMQLLHKYRVEY